MKHLDSNAAVPIACPHCGKEFEKTIGWIESHKEFHCEGVDCPVVFKASDLIRGLKEADKKIEDFGKNLKDMF